MTTEAAATEPQSVMDDPRTITTVSVDGYSWNVGQNGITRIVVYQERGEMSYVPWFAIYCGEMITERINGKMVMGVQYEK